MYWRRLRSFRLTLGDAMIDDQQHFLTIFRQTGALLEGHFQLTSGLHSPRYLQCALVLQYPEHAERAGQALAAYFKDQGIDLRALFAEREAGVMTLRRGFGLKQGERVLVVEDVVTTGGSTRETIEVVKHAGGIVVGAGSIVDRSGGAVDLGVKRHSLVVLNVPVYDPSECPLCKQGTTATKPGSRELKA